jgi:ATP adenylyltransferase/5',5'''-P-1,P-4-tetraphosphate phosphorylase II
MCALAEAMGPKMLLFYNGPRCGASAPDHFHFQACDARILTLFQELPPLVNNTRPTAHSSFGRNMLLFSHTSVRSMQRMIGEAIEGFRQVTAKSQSSLTDRKTAREPMFNLLMTIRRGSYLSILFPRGSHRPSCFTAQGNAQVAISPAALEMAGLLVVSDPSHFERVNAQLVRKIYQEVSLDENVFSQLREILQA